MVINKNQNSNPSIIFENSDFIVVNKPAGLLVHKPNYFSQEKTLVDWLIERYPEIKKVGENLKLRPGIVHRLDRETSGLILIPRHQKAFEYFKNLFQNHQIKKSYLALVHGKLKPKKAIIEKSISLKPGTTKRTVYKGKMTKEAITEYKVLKYYPDFSFVELIPHTGRTHQLRVHLASLHHPIVGDQVYSFRSNPFGLKRQFLHAFSLEFSWNGQRFRIEADLPQELQSIIDRLEKES